MTCIPLLALLNIDYHLLTCTAIFLSVPHSLSLPISFSFLSYFFPTPPHMSLSSQSCLSTFAFLSITHRLLCRHVSFLTFFSCLHPTPSLFHGPSLNVSFSLFSFITWNDWEWRHREEDLEDHRFWPGQGVAQNHKNVSCRHLLLDGPRGHQVISLLQRQWRLEVWQIIPRHRPRNKLSTLYMSTYFWHFYSFLC